MSKDMLLDGGVLRPEEIVEVRTTGTLHLRRVHDISYLDKVQSGRLGRKEEVRLGLPTSPELYTWSTNEVEATRLACHAALAEGVAVSLAGGTHHAFREHGEDFCVFNDVAVAVRDLQDQQPGIKIMVVDTDAHQGNGTNALLANDPRVFTYSIHVARHETACGIQGSMDIETARYVEGDMYLKQLFSTLAAALESFAPDLIIWVAGADNHRNDRFGQMSLSARDIKRRDEVLLRSFIRNRIPVAVVYGGGYNREIGFTAKLHRNTVAAAKKIAAEYRNL